MKRGRIPLYVQKELDRELNDPYHFLSRERSPDREYDSSLSKPGRLCRRCKSFVAGSRDRPCGECFET